MTKELTESIFTKVSADLKKKTKKQSIDIGIDFKDYISLALIHFSNHIENEEIKFDDEMFDN